MIHTAERSETLQRLNTLTNEQIIAHGELLGALYPELLLHHGMYEEIMIKPFYLERFRNGDQTNKWNEQWRQFTVPIEIGASFSVELDATFWVNHFYYCAMFPAFWQALQQVVTIDATLYHRASEVAFFEGKEMEIVECYVQLAMKQKPTHNYRQRSYNKLVVYYAMRNQFVEAKRNGEYCLELAKRVAHDEERHCRLAECYNALALIAFKEDDYSAAQRYIERAIAELSFITDYRRTPRVQQILEMNQQKLREVVSP